MKNSLRSGAVLALVLFCIFIQDARSTILWDGNVKATASAWINPVETIMVDSGTSLTVSAPEDDLWQVFDFGATQFVWTNADGIIGSEYNGIPLGALAGRIGPDGDWFFIGTGFSQTLPDDGILYLACWEQPGMSDLNSDVIRVAVSQEKAVDPADLDPDNDVDGMDLFLYLQDLSVLPLMDFAQMFGWMKITDNATLDTLSVSPGTLCPGFSPDQADYLVELEKDTGQVWITAVPSDPLAGVWINGQKADPGLAFAVSPAPGISCIPVRVVSQDGSTEKAYSLLVTRKGTAFLSDLSAGGYSLSPPFSPDTAVYTLYAGSEAAQVLLTLDTADPSDQIQVNGIPVDPGLPVPVPLETGMTEVEIVVFAPDGSESVYFVYIRKKAPPARTVFLVDNADAENEFETLSQAAAYLNTHVSVDETGEIRIQTTSPMAVDRLDLARNIILSLDPGASNVIAGPPDYPMAINAALGADISGLCFTGSPAYTINSSAGLWISGTSFSSGTTVNLTGSAASVQTKGAGSYGRYFDFVSNSLSGHLNIMMSGAADTDLSISGNQAESIQFAGAGELVGDAGLNFKANLTGELKIMASLKGNTHASILAHQNLANSDFGITMEESALFRLRQHTSALVGMDFNGLQGRIELENVTTANAVYKADLKESGYTGTANSITRFTASLRYTHGDCTYGITQKGVEFFQSYSIIGENAPLNANLTLGLDGVDIYGKYNLIAGGKVTASFKNNTTITMDAYMKLPGRMTSLDFDHMSCYGRLSMEFPESGVQLYLNAQYATLEEGMFMDFMEPAAISGTLDHVVTVTGGIMGRFGSVEEMDVLDKSMVLPKGETLVFKNLDIKDTQGRPALFLEKISVPVTIQDSRIESQTWAVVCEGINAAVTIRDNDNLKGGIFLNGDPGETGAMIDQPCVVSGNTITQSMAGGSCLASHAIRHVQTANNTLTATGGANGIMLSGGKMTVDGGSITAMGGAALMTGPSAGGTTGFLDVRNLDPVSGFVFPAEQGYVKLSDNTFSNATVFDVEQGRLINDPMAEGNSGLNPDQDIVGCLIDWNDDEHHCPDYPPRCDEWDEDSKQCGCSQNGIDPPSEPGI